MPQESRSKLHRCCRVPGFQCGHCRSVHPSGSPPGARNSPCHISPSQTADHLTNHTASIEKASAPTLSINLMKYSSFTHPAGTWIKPGFRYSPRNNPPSSKRNLHDLLLTVHGAGCLPQLPRKQDTRPITDTNRSPETGAILNRLARSFAELLPPSSRRGDSEKDGVSGASLGDSTCKSCRKEPRCTQPIWGACSNSENVPISWENTLGYSNWLNSPISWEYHRSCECCSILHLLLSKIFIKDWPFVALGILPIEPPEWVGLQPPPQKRTGAFHHVGGRCSEKPPHPVVSFGYQYHIPPSSPKPHLGCHWCHQGLLREGRLRWPFWICELPLFWPRHFSSTWHMKISEKLRTKKFSIWKNWMAIFFFQRFFHVPTFS